MLHQAWDICAALLKMLLPWTYVKTPRHAQDGLLSQAYMSHVLDVVLCMQLLRA